MGAGKNLTREYQQLREKIYQSIFAGLNKQQMEVVATGEGPVLCLAGAGSGKTMAMIYRILHLYLFGAEFEAAVLPPHEISLEDLAKMQQWLQEWEKGVVSCFSPEIINLLRVNGVSPQAILAITFTNKAAEEMKTRLANLLGTISEKMWVMTFHAACVRILHREISSLGYTSNFAIYDSQDQLVLLRAICKELNLDEKKFAPKKIQNAISRYKCKLQTPSKAKIMSNDFLEKKYIEVYEIYQRRLQENNALDFDDLIMLTVRLFQEEPEILEKYQERFRYIMVDEYQDTNHAQYALVNTLAKKYQNLCVVGDDDQSIYGFRAADIRNILDFERDYPEARVIKLEQNYRSTQLILDAANEVIAHNSGRKAKKLWTENSAGEPILCFTAIDEGDEAAFVVEKIEELKGQGVNYGDCAVLMRTNAQSRTLEEWLIRIGIPYKLIGGVKFYERKEIKDILAYLKFLVNPCDALSLKRIINEPRRGIGEITFSKIANHSWEKGIPIYQALLEYENLGIVGKTAKAVADFINLLESFRQSLEKLTVTELTKKILEETGYWQQLKRENSPEAESRIENLQEFLTKTLEYDHFAEENSLGDFLSQVALVTDLDNLQEKEEAVVVMTMHSAKGLEFPHVFLIGLEEGIFPHYRAFDDLHELEEERRLCYVAMTRAKERLYLVNARERYLYGRKNMNQSSRFLEEVPPQLCIQYNRPGFFETTPAYAVGNNAAGSVAVKEQAGRKGQIFMLGDKVFHQKWGEGVIVSIKGQGSEIELAIAFPEEGIKTVLAKYAPLKKLR
ncbi:MAG TPA: DNA helicase PcrA [Clostridia bacterium]|nr:DNA helicase PcrA [Clostridia bacterium]HHY05508.1 DNA helicase PcrA [Clostridia bacterium]